jgi:prevent-host-death family protein
MREIKASEFKAKCLKLIDEVNATGEAIIITKRGKVVARLDSARAKVAKPFGRGKELVQTVNPKDDLVGILSSEDASAWYRIDPLLDVKPKPMKVKKPRK